MPLRIYSLIHTRLSCRSRHKVLAALEVMVCLHQNDSMCVSVVR